MGNDPILKRVIPDKPQVIFKGAPSLRNRLAPNALDPPVRGIQGLFDNLKGYYKCGRCRVCRLNSVPSRRTLKFTSSSTQEEHDIKPFITCATEGVVYLLQCPCGLQYVGRTRRPLSVRLNEHITNIINGFPKHSVSKHYLVSHNKDPSKTLFLGIDRYRPHWRGSSLTRSISKLEMLWIHKIRCYVPHGLNVDTDTNAFIDNS